MGDGKVVISTKLDNSGIEKDAKQTKNILKKGFSDASKESEIAGKNIEKNIGNGIDRATKKTGGLKQALMGIGKAIILAFSAKAVVDFGKESFKLANTFESSMQQISRMMGESTETFADWMKTQATAFNMSRRQAAQYGAVFANLISAFEADSEKIMSDTTQLLQASSIIASATGRTMDDVMERIRSGLLGNTEAIEDLGIYANVSMIESTNAFKKFANGKSWQQLDYQTQQQIRLMSILEQTTARYGTTLMSNTATSVSQLSAQWDNLKTSVGQAIQPIARMVIPILSQLIIWLDRAAQSVAAFLNALFGKSNDKQKSTGIANVAEDANNAASAIKDTSKDAKKLENNLAGFDKLDVLSKPDGSGGTSGSSTGTKVPSNVGGGVAQEFEDAPIWVEKFKKSLQSLVGYVSSKVAPAFNGAIRKITPEIDQLKGTISTLFSGIKGLSVPFQQWLTNDFVGFLSSFVSSAGTILWGLFDSFNLVFSDIVSIAVLPTLGTFTTTVLPTLTQFASQLVSTFASAFELLKLEFDTFWSSVIAPAMELVVHIWQDLWEIVSDLWSTYGKPIFDKIKLAIEGIKKTFLNVWNNFLNPIFTTLFDTLRKLWDEHLKPLVTKIGTFAAKWIQAALDIYNQFILPLVNWFTKTLGPPISRAINMVIESIGMVLGSISDAVGGIFDALGGLMDFISGVFTGNWSKAWEGIKSIFSGVFNALYNIAKIPINGIIKFINMLISGINVLISGLNKLSFDIPDNIPFVGGLKLGFNIPNIPSIPYLARGAVIPPNREFLAVLGDQRNGRNLEVPESLLRQIYREESGTQDITITFAGDLAQLVRILKPQIEKETKRTGTRLVKGGISFA